MTQDNFSPTYSRNENSIVFRLFEQKIGETKIEDIEAVLDLNAEDEIIGLEIIDLKYLTGIKNIKEFSDVERKMSLIYDDSCDALSLWLVKESSKNQESHKVSVITDSGANLRAIEIPIKSK